MKQRAVAAADFGRAGDGLNRAGLVVRPHQADQGRGGIGGTVGQKGFQRIEVGHARPVDRQDRRPRRGGADGVMFSPTNHEVLDAFSQRIQNLESNKALNLQVGTIVRTQPIGIGYRSCIDLATIFSNDDAVVAGSAVPSFAPETPFWPAKRVTAPAVVTARRVWLPVSGR